MKHAYGYSLIFCGFMFVANRIDHNKWMTISWLIMSLIFLIQIWIISLVEERHHKTTIARRKL